VRSAVRSALHTDERQLRMAQTNKDFMTRLADRGEQVVGRITDLPGAKTLLDGTTALAKRMDDVQKSLRKLDPLEKRVTALERRLEKLEGKGAARKKASSTTKRTTSARSSTAKRSTASSKPSTRRQSSSS
jgi:hypothetical protein